MSARVGLRRAGLAAPVLRWVLWSRRRAVGCVLLGLAAAIVLARLVTALHHPAPPVPTLAPPPAPAPPSSASPTPSASPEDVPAPGSSPELVATRFAARWVAHDGIDPARWLVGLQPLCTEAYGSQVLPTVDPATVPASRVTGPARVIRRDRRAAEVSVPLDQLTIRVSLLEISGAEPDQTRWRVNDVNPAGAG